MGATKMERLPILLLDDDILALKHICRMAEWNTLGFQEPVCCTRCSQARTEMIRRPFAVCFLDIELPGEDGLEFGAWVRQNYPDTVIYMLTSYREFNYAKRAVDIGASSYLLKHELTSEKLQQLLLNTKGMIREIQYRNQSINDFAFSAIVAGDRSVSISDLNGQKLSLAYIHPQYSFSLVYREKKETVSWLDEIRAKVAMDQQDCLVSSMPDGLWVLLHANGTWQIRDKTEKLDAALSILPSRCEYSRTGIFDRQEEIGSRCEALKTAAEDRFYESRDRVDRIIADPHRASETGTLHMQPVLAAWDLKQKKEFETNLHVLLAEISRYQHRDGALDHICQQLCSSMGILPEDEYFWTLKELEEWFIRKSDRLMNPFAGRNLSPLTRQVLNCCDTSIGIRQEELAEMLHVSSSHLRTVFKKETGLTISGYILQNQMRYARYLLCVRKKKATEVAAELGYQSSQYFSKVFRQETGMTPGEFVRLYQQGRIRLDGKQTGVT